MPIETHVERYDLADANRALADLRAGTVQGAAVLVPVRMTTEERPVYERARGARHRVRRGTSIRRSRPPRQAEQYWAGIDATHCKNLFLRNQKGTKHYLVILNYLKRADLQGGADQIGDGKLSFASPERLMTHLGVTPGSVSPFGLIHDRDHIVRVVLDRDLKDAERISFHPNINTATVVLAFADFVRFLDVVRQPGPVRHGLSSADQSDRATSPSSPAPSPPQPSDLPCHTCGLDWSHEAGITASTDYKNDEWVTFPGGELEGKRPGRCVRRAGALQAARPSIGRSAASAAKAPWQRRSASSATARSSSASGRSRRPASSTRRPRSGFQSALPFEPVNRPRLEMLKAERRLRARPATHEASGRFADRRRQAQIAARHALQRIAAGLAARRLRAGERERDDGGGDSRRRAPAPESWLPFVVAR